MAPGPDMPKKATMSSWFEINPAFSSTDDPNWPRNRRNDFSLTKADMLDKVAGSRPVFAMTEIPAKAVNRKPASQEAGKLQDCVPDFKQISTRLRVISKYGNPVTVRDCIDRPAALFIHT